MSQNIDMKQFSIDNLTTEFCTLKNNKEYSDYTDIELLIKIVTEKSAITTKFDKENGTSITEEFFSNTLADLSPLGLGSFDLVQATEDKFNFQYLLYTPEHIEHNILLMEGNNGPNFFEEGEMVNKGYIPAALSCSKLIEFFSFLNCPCFIPLLPAEDSRVDKKSSGYEEKFPRQLSRNSVVNEKDSPLYRTDLQLLSAMEDAKEKVLAKTGITLDEKSFLYGFSTSGNLAIRLAFLHPNNFFGVCAGGINALVPVPIESYNNTNLIYPVGTYDYEVITGSRFPSQVYKDLSKMYFIGEKEPQEIYNTIFYPELHSPEVRDTFIRGLDADMFIRANKINDIYCNYGYSSENEDTIQIVPTLDHNPYPMMEVMQAFTQKTIEKYEKSVCYTDCNTK